MSKRKKYKTLRLCNTSVPRCALQGVQNPPHAVLESRLRVTGVAKRVHCAQDNEVTALSAFESAATNVCWRRQLELRASRTNIGRRVESLPDHSSLNKKYQRQKQTYKLGQFIHYNNIKHHN